MSMGVSAGIQAKIESSGISTDMNMNLHSFVSRVEQLDLGVSSLLATSFLCFLVVMLQTISITLILVNDKGEKANPAHKRPHEFLIMDTLPPRRFLILLLQVANGVPTADHGLIGRDKSLGEETSTEIN
jgi:hypothetical protein